MKTKVPELKIKKLKLKIPSKKNFSTWIKKINFKKLVNSITNGKPFILILALLLLLINYLSSEYFIRLDTTDSQNFSISQTSKEIINNIEDTITIEVYFSENIPPNLSEPRQNVLDLMEEYSKSSNGKILLDIKDPMASDFETNAQTKGIQRIQFSEFGQDKFSVAQGFLGLAFVTKDSTETIPVVASIDNLEYEATSRILKLSAQEGKNKIGFYSKFPAPESSDGETDLPIQPESVLTNLATIRELLSRQYDVEEIDLSKGKPIDSDEFKVVVVIAPSAELSERDLFEIEQYMLKGGTLLVLEDLLKLGQSSPLLNKSDSNLNTLLSKIGLSVETKVLLDESFTPIVSGLDRIAYPYWVLVTSDGINNSIPVLNTLQSATLLWSNPIQKDEKEGLVYTELLNTTDQAWTESGEVINIDFKEFSPTDQKRYTLSYLVEGKYISSYKDKELPKLENESSTDDRKSDDLVINETENIRVVVIGDSDFISDNFINANEQNPALFLNLVDWLSESEDLSSIRAKGVTTRPLEALENDEKNIYKTINSISAPILVTLTGFVYLKRRKKSAPKI